MELQFRHGDVFLRAVSALPEGATPQPRQGDVILAEGEVTGHAHRVKDVGVALYEHEGRRYLSVPEAGAALTHEEHARIELAPGLYETFIQREYDEEAGWRQVLD